MKKNALWKHWLFPAISEKEGILFQTLRGLKLRPADATIGYFVTLLGGTAAGRAKVAAEPGQEIIPFAPAQLAAWRATAVPLQQSWAETVRRAGADPDAIAREFATSLAEHHAQY